MVASIESFIDQTQDISSQLKLRTVFLSAVADEGYENAVFARVDNKRLVSIPWSEFPPGYLDTYRAEQWDRIDPVVKLVQTARGPFSWSAACPSKALPRVQRNFFEQCRELGVHSGITIPIRGMAAEVDLISLSLRQKGRASEHRATHVYGLAVQYWLKYCQLADGDRQEAQQQQLTRQETECLRWCKDGKTNWEIGEILSISEKTAEFHLSNAMRKLGATNRITAVVMAIKGGLIPL